MGGYRSFTAGCLLCACVVGLAACATDYGRRAAFVKSRPDAGVDVKNAVMSGEILEGMSEDEVRASWGTPLTAAAAGDGGTTTARWTYLDRIGSGAAVYEVRFIDGRVAAVESLGYRDAPLRRRYFAPAN